MINPLSNDPKVNDDTTHQTWTFTITEFTNPPSTKPVTTPWKSKFRQVLTPATEPADSYGDFFDTEFVLGFTSESEDGIIECTSRTNNAATSVVDIVVLGTHLHDT